MSRLFLSGFLQLPHRGYLPDKVWDVGPFFGSPGAVLAEESMLAKLEGVPSIIAVNGDSERYVKVILHEASVEVGFYPTGVGQPKPEKVLKFKHILNAVEEVDRWWSYPTT